MRKWLVWVALLAGTQGTFASAGGSYLFTIDGTQPLRYSAGRAMLPIQVDEEAAIQAAHADGELIVPSPDGGRLVLHYVGHQVHDDGDWTWIGAVAGTVDGPKAVITFGDHAIYGYVPRDGLAPLQLTTQDGHDWVYAGADASLPAISVGSLSMSPRSREPVTENSAAEMLAKPVAAAFPASGVIDLLAVLSKDYRAQFASDAAAYARVDYLVDFLNQALSDSQVPWKYRVVKKLDVDYVKNSYVSPSSADGLPDDFDALYDAAETGSPASLAGVRRVRQRYGADVVALITARGNLVNACDGGAVLLGHNGRQIEVSDWGDAYVVYGETPAACDGIPFARALGDLEGLVDGSREPDTGAYPFAHAYTSTTAGGARFSTLMGVDGQVLPYFSNPDITKCFNAPCGVADAYDSARALRLTLPPISGFLTTRDPSQPLPGSDLDGDNRSDLFWLDARTSRLSLWPMIGASRSYSRILSVPSGAQLLARGDFTGDGRTDILWALNGRLVLWTSIGWTYVGAEGRSYPTGWSLLAAGDMNGDGKADLVWRDKGGTRVSRWIMDGETLVSSSVVTVPANWTFLTAADFNGDGRTDLLWKAGGDIKLWTSTGSSFTEQVVRPYPGGAWVVAASADLDGDGKADLIWRDERTQRVSFWLMSGTTLVRSWAQSLRSVWHLGATGDYDGDGKADLVWVSDSSVVLWTNVSSQVVGQTIDRYPTGWTLLGP